MATFAILGMGGFGLALAVMLNNFNHEVTVWSKFPSEAETIRRNVEYKEKLPGVKISSSIDLTSDINCV